MELAQDLVNVVHIFAGGSVGMAAVFFFARTILRGIGQAG